MKQKLQYVLGWYRPEHLLLHPEPTGRISVYKVICFLIRGFHNLNRTKLLLKIPVLIHTYIHHGKTTAVLPN